MILKEDVRVSPSTHPLIKRIKKYVECEDGFVALIQCKYNSETKEVLHEEVVFMKKGDEDES